MDQKNEGILLAVLKSRPTKAGGQYFEGKLGNIVVIKAFFKKDGSGLVIKMENPPMQPRPEAHPYSPQNAALPPPYSAAQRVKPKITPRPQAPQDTSIHRNSNEEPPEGMWDESWGEE